MSLYSTDFSDMAEFNALSQSIAAKLCCDDAVVCVCHDDALVELGQRQQVAANLNRRTLTLTDVISGRVVRSGGAIAINDVLTDPTTCEMPLGQSPLIAAVLGVPLIVEGRGAVGAICATSTTPRVWREADAAFLRAVSGLVESRIERQLLRYEQKQLCEALAENDAVLNVLSNRRGDALTVHNGDGTLVFASSGLRSELKLSNQDMLALPNVARRLQRVTPQHGAIKVELPSQSGAALQARVSDADNGLTLVEWFRDPLE